MAYEKAAIRHARVAREWREQREQHQHERIAEVVAEFGGDADASATLSRMAQALLDYRHLLQQFIDAGEMIREGKPFIVMGPGRHWTPDPSKQWP
jgi:hypothetical protein